MAEEGETLYSETDQRETPIEEREAVSGQHSTTRVELVVKGAYCAISH